MKAIYNVVTFLAALVILAGGGWCTYKHWNVLVGVPACPCKSCSCCPGCGNGACTCSTCKCCPNCVGAAGTSCPNCSKGK